MDTRLSSFESDREFTVFSYGISHGLLLLRSGKTNEHKTRIDVLIRDVRAMEIRFRSDGLKIEEVDREYLRDFRSNPIETLQRGHRVYALRGKGWQGYIVGGILSVQEDESDYMAPSGLIRERF